MRQVKLYECEFCKNVFDDAFSCMECESTHYGIDVRKYIKWRQLYRDLFDATYKAVKNSGDAQDEFDDAFNKLVEFEHDNALSLKDCPESFKVFTI